MRAKDFLTEFAPGDGEDNRPGNPRDHYDVDRFDKALRPLAYKTVNPGWYDIVLKTALGLIQQSEFEEAERYIDKNFPSAIEYYFHRNIRKKFPDGRPNPGYKPTRTGPPRSTPPTGQIANGGTINESTFSEHEAQLRDFVAWCVEKLKIQQALPRIRFQDAKEGPDQHRTGYYDDNDDIMWIYTGNRNLIDIMRTVAHELAHRKQHEDNRVHGNQAYPGSPIEQQADAVAGYLMKLYGKDNPEIIE